MSLKSSGSVGVFGAASRVKYDWPRTVASLSFWIWNSVLDFPKFKTNLGSNCKPGGEEDGTFELTVNWIDWVAEAM